MLKRPKYNRNNRSEQADAARFGDFLEQFSNRHLIFTRVSGNAMSSEELLSERQTTRPSERIRTIVPREAPRNVFTRSPGLRSADSQSDSTMAVMDSRSRTPAM